MLFLQILLQKAILNVFFASEQISRLLVERFVLDKQFMNVVSDIPECTGWHGYMLEALMHKTITTGAQVTFRFLDGKDKNVVQEVIQIKFFLIKMNQLMS